jgi:hypothetical protein
MTVRSLQSQEAQHVESGAVLRSHGREALQFELDGHTLTITRELADDGDILYLATSPSWDDGEPLNARQAALLEPVIHEIEGFWDLKAHIYRI